MELLQYRQRLFRKAVFENALNDSAAIRMSGEGKNLRDICNYTSLVTTHTHTPIHPKTQQLNLLKYEGKKKT